MAKRTTKMSEQVGLRLEPEFFQEIEEWRRDQRPTIPSRTDAIRALVRAGLQAYKGKLPKKPRTEN
jgi:hypothetical protein